MQRVCILLLFCCWSGFAAQAQQKSLRLRPDTLATGLESAMLIPTAADSIKSDTALAATASLESLGVRISADALDEVVTSHATDSALIDVRTNNFILYGNANVQYDGRKLSADQIDFNQASNIARAKYVHDSARKTPAIPLFEQGQEKFTYDSLQYNFKSQRAIVQNARSQYGEGFVHSDQVKRNADQSLYGWQNVYTTCSLPEPHFGIRTRRIKVIPEQAIASGPANFEIEGIPTPVFLPFGYFPINNEQHRSGFILPRYSVDSRGNGLQDLGYYFSINDHVDLKLLTSIFTKGSYAVGIQSDYVTRYQYNGQLQLNYTQTKTGESYEPGSFIRNDYKIYWVHNKDAKSRPGVAFNGKIDVQSGKYNALNSYTTSQILQSSFRSNLTWSKSWANKPYSLTLSATHEQNNISRQTTFSAPNISFFISNISPFQRKNPVGKTRWYEKISGSYNLIAVNQLQYYDTAFKLSQLQLTDFRNGVKHSIPVSASYQVLRFITSTFNISYNEYWNSSRMFRAYNPLTGRVDTTVERNFFASRDFNAGLSLATQIYGMKMFRGNGAVRGIRHTIRPTINLNYHPDFAKSPFNYGYETRLDNSSPPTYLSPYEGSILGGYPAIGRNGSIGFNLNNNLQMKIRNRKDTALGTKNIPILDAFDIGTGYNLAVDSFQWQNINISARTNILNKLNVSANAVYDPYNYDYNAMRRTSRTMQAAGTGWARLTSASVTMNMSLRSKPKSERKNDSLVNSADYKALMRNNGYSRYVDFNIPWSLNFIYSLNMTRQPSMYSRSDTSLVNQTLQVNGDFNFTPRWKLGFSTGYNLVDKKVTLTSLDIYRDMHCTEMHLNIIPFGGRRSFYFMLNVKAQVLQNLKLTRQRNFLDEQ